MKPETGKLNMDDLAKRLGVSKTTVHYAISESGRLSPQTRRRVLKLVDQLGYRPDGLARSFRRGRTESVGVVLANLTNSFHAHLLEGIEGVARQNRHATFIACSYGGATTEREMINLFLDKSIDGIIVVPSHPIHNLDFYRDLLKQGVQLVFVDREVPGLEVDLVSTDHERGGYLVAQHLIKLGRKQIVCVATRKAEHRPTSTRERLSGIERALREADLPAPIVLGTDPADFTVHERYGYEVMHTFLKNGAAHFDAVCATHDGVAYGVIRALTEASFRVPHDIAVVGYDDQDPSAYFQPTLTTVRQPVREIGMEASHLLLRRLKEKERDTPVIPQRIAIQPTLVIRESSGGTTSALQQDEGQLPPAKP